MLDRQKSDTVKATKRFKPKGDKGAVAASVTHRGPWEQKAVRQFGTSLALRDCSPAPILHYQSTTLLVLTRLERIWTDISNPVSRAEILLDRYALAEQMSSAAAPDKIPSLDFWGHQDDLTVPTTLTCGNSLKSCYLLLLTYYDCNPVEPLHPLYSKEALTNKEQWN